MPECYTCGGVKRDIFTTVGDAGLTTVGDAGLTPISVPEVRRSSA